MSGEPSNPPASGPTITGIEQVATFMLHDRSLVHGDDPGKLLLDLNPKYPALPQTDAELGRQVVSGLIEHLLFRDDWRAARQYLTSFTYLAARIAHFGIGALLDDFRSFVRRVPQHTDAELRLLRDTLTLIEPMLRFAPSQLPEQLLARIPTASSSRLRQLRDAAQSYKHGMPWLCPVEASFIGPATGMLRIFDDHEFIPGAVACTPDGALLISADERQLVLRQVGETRPVEILDGPGEEVLNLVVTADGRYIVAAIRAPDLVVWPFRPNATPERLRGHTSVARSLLVLPDGSVLSGGSNGQILLWHPSNPEPELFGRTQAPIQSLALAADATWFASAEGTIMSGCSTLALWDIHRRSVRRTITFEGETIDVIAVTGDDRYLLAAANKRLLRWELPEGNTPETVGEHDWKISRVVASRDGRWAITADTGGTIRAWDMETRRPPHIFRGHTGYVGGLVLSDAGWLASAAHDRTVRCWLFPPAAEPSTSQLHREAIRSLAVVSGNGRTLAITGSSDQTIARWDVNAHCEWKRLTLHQKWVSCIAAVPSRGWFVSAGWDGLIAVWDTATAEFVRSFTSPEENIEALAVSPCGCYCATVPFEGPLRLWNLETGEPLARSEQSFKNLSSLRWTGNSTLLAAGHGLIEFEWKDERLESRSMNEQHLSINAIASIPGVPQFLLATSKGIIARLDTQVGQISGAWQDGPCGIADIAVAGNARWAVSVGGLPHSSSDHTIRLWDCDTGKVLARFLGDCPFTCCAVTPDDRHVLAGDCWGQLHQFQVDVPGNQ
jgi:WD40 repeat protein